MKRVLMLLVILFSFSFVSAVSNPDIFGHQMGEIDWTMSSCSGGQIMIGISNSGTASCSSFSVSNLSAPDGSPSAALVVDNDGNVQVTGSGDTKIQVNAAGASSKAELVLNPTGTDNSFLTYENNLIFYSSGLGNVITINPSGNVGIGTPTPEAGLHVVGTINTNGNAYGFFGRTAPTDNAGIVFRTANSASTQWLIGKSGILNSEKLVFAYPDWSSGNERMVIDPNGAVGIGTTSPGYKLDVADAGGHHIGIGGPYITFDTQASGGYGYIRNLKSTDVNDVGTVFLMGPDNKHVGKFDRGGLELYGNDISAVGNIAATGTVCDVNGCIGGGSGGVARLASQTLSGAQDISGSAISGSATPTIGQGVQLFSVSAAASSASSKISLRGDIQASTGYGGEPALFTIWKDSTLVTSVIGAVPIGGVTIVGRTSFEVELAVSDTSSHTYQVRVGSANARGVMLNKAWGNTMGGTIKSIFVVDEILS